MKKEERREQKLGKIYNIYSVRATWLINTITSKSHDSRRVPFSVLEGARLTEHSDWLNCKQLTLTVYSYMWNMSMQLTTQLMSAKVFKI